MRKILLLFLTCFLSLSIVAVAFAGYNPYDDKFKHEARQLRQSGTAKNVFLIFDENKNQINEPFEITYHDNEKNNKTFSSGNAGHGELNFTNPGYFKIESIRYNNVTYTVFGKDAFEDFDYEDIYEGEVNFYVIEINKSSSRALIYEAD